MGLVGQTMCLLKLYQYFSEGQVRVLEECVSDAIAEHNKLAAASEGYGLYCLIIQNQDSRFPHCGAWTILE